MKQFDITYFYGPYGSRITDPTVVRHIAESGMTLIPLHYDTETNKKALPLLAEQGIRANVGDPRIVDLYNREDLASTDEVIRSVVLDYQGYDNVAGWDLVDEPHAGKFPILAAITAAFRKYTPDKETVINLFPNYASPKMCGTPDYRTYLTEFADVVHPHLLSYDHYHFLGRGSRQAIIECTDTREREIRLAAEKTEDRGGFFENIELVRAVAEEKSLDPMLIVLLTEHGPYRNLTRGELFWEVNMSLVYGMRRISYFTYWEPASDVEFWRWTNAMCDAAGNRTPHYYDVQAINGVITPVGRVLFDKKSLAVFHVGPSEEGTTSFAPFGGIAAIDGDDAVIGFFEGGYVYLVNRSFTHENTYRIHAASPLTRYANDGFVPFDGAVTLGAGEAVLLRIENT